MAWRTGGWSSIEQLGCGAKRVQEVSSWRTGGQVDIMWRQRCSNKTLTAGLKILLSDSTFRLTSTRRRFSFTKRFLMVNDLDVEGRSSTYIKSLSLRIVWRIYKGSDLRKPAEGSWRFLSMKKRHGVLPEIYGPTRLLGQMNSSWKSSNRLQTSSRLFYEEVLRLSKMKLYVHKRDEHLSYLKSA